MRAHDRRWTRRRLAAVSGLLVVASTASAERGFDAERALEDVITVRVLGREMLAFDGLGGGVRKQRLEPGENVLWSGARGRIGLIVTDRRALAVRRGQGFRVLRFRVREGRDARVSLGDRVALVATSGRLLAFDGAWRQADLGALERLQVLSVGPGAALAVTDRRALAMTSASNGFVATPLHLHERVEIAEAGSALAEVTTSRRVLVFSGAGTWTEQRRSLY
jgi:hypothetical protein